MNQGIIVAGDGGQVTNQRDRTYDSTKRHMQLNMIKKNPKMFDIVEMPAGSPLVVNEGFSASEDLLTITHGLDYKPAVWVYFFVWPKGTDPDVMGFYSTGAYIFAGSTVNDIVSYEVDESAFRITHEIENFFFGGPYTSFAAQYTLRVKYYIFNLPATNTFVDIGNSDIIINN